MRRPIHDLLLSIKAEFDRLLHPHRRKPVEPTADPTLVTALNTVVADNADFTAKSTVADAKHEAAVNAAHDEQLAVNDKNSAGQKLNDDVTAAQQLLEKYRVPVNPPAPPAA